MPFLGQDWRCPGEQWVKTVDGWERLRLWRLKLFENLNENVIARLVKLAYEYEDVAEISNRTGPQPHVHMLKAVTREQNMQTSLCESFNRLDFRGAVKDRKRFNYVSKLLGILISEHLHNLSGSAQKNIFSVLEEMLTHVVKTQNHIDVMQQLLEKCEKALENGKYYHLGSSQLWAKHAELLNKMQETLNSLEIRERQDDGGKTITDLPDECIRQILQRLPDGKDLQRTGLTATRHFDLTEDVLLWRDLCLYHFTDRQIVSVIKKGETLFSVGWKGMYQRLRKRYGLKDTYAEMIHLCRHCNALFWKCHGHPCHNTNLAPESLPVTPVMFVDLCI